MSLEFEKLASSVEDMVRQTNKRREQQEEQLEDALARITAYAASWDFIDKAVEMALDRGNAQYYRAARPLHHSTPLNVGVPAPPPPARATIIACDGSQIVPDRHAPFPYYLINIGLITYHHGSGLSPDPASEPLLAYPRSDESDEEDPFTSNSALVGLRRDRLEIKAVADLLDQNEALASPRLAILDQRLLYWPAGGLPERESDHALLGWQESMIAIWRSGAWLAGFIDRPAKQSVLTMLHTLDIKQPGFDVSELYHSTLFNRLTDTDLFAHLLQTGERSPVFTEISHLNTIFRGREKAIEVCFFYLRTGDSEGQLARIDIPRWVAEDEERVAAVHALIYDQCQILGSYPYVITRADEIAVVGRREQEELEYRIALRLAERGVETQMTSKQQSKQFARSSKTRMKG